MHHTHNRQNCSLSPSAWRPHSRPGRRGRGRKDDTWHLVISDVLHDLVTRETATIGHRRQRSMRTQIDKSATPLLEGTVVSEGGRRNGAD